MATWSGTRAKLENEYLAPSLRGRIQYFATSYSKCPDHEGRAAVRLDGEEIFKSSYYEYCFVEWNVRQRIAHSEVGLSPQDEYRKARQMALDEGAFDQRDFYTAFREFDNQSIECSLVSANPIVRMFALLDGRVGKRRLIALKNSMDNEVTWLQVFYRLRCEAEKVYGIIFCEDVPYEKN